MGPYVDTEVTLMAGVGTKKKRENQNSSCSATAGEPRGGQKTIANDDGERWQRNAVTTVQDNIVLFCFFLDGAD